MSIHRIWRHSDLIRIGRVTAIVCAVSAVISGQAPTTQIFRSRADMVPVYVSVIGRDGQPITGLQARDFSVLDGGKKQPIAVFSAASHPFAVTLVLDVTYSMRLGSGFPKQVTFARALADALGADDQVALGSLTMPLARLSADKTSVSQMLRWPADQLAKELAPEVSSQLGLEWAISSLASYEGRRIVIIFTDGQSTPAGLNLEMFTHQDPVQLAEQLVRRAERADVSIHAVAFDDTMVEEGFLSAFANTGGGASLIARDADLASVARAFVDELHHEYLLAFMPSKSDGKSHRIEVRVNRPDAKVRARRSYFAPKR